MEGDDDSDDDDHDSDNDSDKDEIKKMMMMEDVHEMSHIHHHRLINYITFNRSNSS